MQKKMSFLVSCIVMFLTALNIFSQQYPASQGRIKFDVDIADDAGIDTVSEIVRLKNIKASEIEPFIQSRLSRYGTVQVNDALNMIIITDKKIKVNDLSNLVRELDISGIKDFVRLETQTLYLKYTQAGVIKPLLETRLSSEGKILVDSDHNALVVTDVKSKIDLIRQLLPEIDKKIPQIMVEVKIVEVNDDYTRKLGIDWSNFTGLIPQIYGGYSEDESKAAISLYNQKITRVYTNFNLNLFELNNFVNLMVTEGNAKILSTPKIITLNNQPATIYSGETLPYTYPGSTYESATNLGLSLNVTPVVKSENLITLSIGTSINNLSGWSPRGVPVINSRNLNTTIDINDNQTYVIGGLEKSTLVNSVKGIPVLKDLPILGYLFGKKVTTKLTTQLLVFITPKIIKEGEITGTEEFKKLEDIKKELKEY